MQSDCTSAGFKLFEQRKQSRVRVQRSMVLLRGRMHVFGRRRLLAFFRHLVLHNFSLFIFIDNGKSNDDDENGGDEDDGDLMQTVTASAQKRPSLPKKGSRDFGASPARMVADRRSPYPQCPLVGLIDFQTRRLHSFGAEEA
jgi:hypothetical protein